MSESVCDIYCQKPDSKACCKCKNGPVSSKCKGKKYKEADFEFGKEAEYEEVTRKNKKKVMTIKGKGTLETQDGMSPINQTAINRLKGNKLSEAGRRQNIIALRPKPQIYKSSGSKKKGSRYQDLKF